MKNFVAKQTNLARKYSYLKKPRYIVKLQLTLKKQRVILLFNQLQIFGVKSKDDKQRQRHCAKRFQKKCHVRNKSKTGDRNSSHRPKPKSKAQINKETDGGEKVDAPSEAVGSSTTATQSESIEAKTSTDNMRVLVTPERDEAKSVPATAEEVNEQIREQLKLLQSGRRSSISLLPNSGNTTRGSSVIGTKTPSCTSTPSYSRHASYSSLEGDPIRSTDGHTPKSTTASASAHTVSNQKPKFIDSLISKLKTQGLNLPTSNNDENQSTSTQSSPEKSAPNPPPQKPLIQYESIIDNAIDDSRLSDHSTSSADGFLGFKEDEAQFERPNIPGMLPTPVVRRSKGVKSAFVSEELDNFMKENALDNNSYRTAPLKKRHDEAMMYAEAEPPSLLCPQLPSDVEKPRTVAEKRQLLERKADIKYLMIENESTVYRELRKRAKAGPVPNYTLIRNIQQMNIPFTRDCWRATCWLNTPNGRFYYQTIRDNGKDVKVMGGRGNNVVKELVQLKPMNKKKFANQECSKTCRLIGNIKINGLDELITETTNQNAESSFTAKKLNTLSDGYSFQKPGPLSLKKLNPIKSSIDVELGPLELYSLPTIQLEVWPKLDRPLPEAVHPYLKLALPYENITPEWAEFALSTLKQATPPPSRRKRKRTTTEPSVDANRSFTFNIPYTNNQSRILVRKRRQMVPVKLAKLNSINDNDTAELSFMKDVDKSDDVAVAVADVLTGMIDSVALSLCEASMVTDDPQIDYGKVDGQVESGDGKAVGMNAVDGKNKKTTPGGKVVKELKKLNAKIIHGFNDSWVKKEECRNAFCRLGCICDSLRGSQTYSYHCKEVDCMFQCKCPSSKINTSTFESAVHNSDIKQYCDRMNASLAKEEKDFTATVVVSEGKTIYVPTWDEKKKRLKKVPKRLSDCVQFESDFVHRDLSETLLTKEENRMRASKPETVERVDDQVLTSSKNDMVKSMIHVNVNVERLDVLDNLEPLCMIHGLYKCFCKFRAVDGRRFEFSNSKIDVIEQPVYTKKRQYTFERNKDEPANKYMAVADEDLDYSATCRRVRVVDTNHQKIKNRVRLETIRRKIKTIERDHPERKRLLENRIKRCIAMPEVGQLVTVPDARDDTPGISNAEVNKSGHSMESDVMEQSSSSGVRDSITSDANATKYRSRFNNIICKTMQGISQKLKSMTSLPSPVNKAFYYMQWKHFVKHFNEDRIYVWEVQLNTKEVLLVVTDKNIMPIVSNAMYVINIKAVSTERLPLLPKLIKLGVENEETNKLSVLLFGVSNYWRVLGCTHSKNDFMNDRVIAVPTPDANPALASKISSLFNDMVKLTAQKSSKQSTHPSNICIRKMDTSNIDKIQLPIPVNQNQRWYFMLSLANDFSHIYVPAWKQFISHKKIMLAIDHAKKTQQTVQFGPDNLSPQLYVSHNSDMKLFFGPMVKNETLNLQLLQQHEGKMIQREEYQRMTEQTTNVNVTVGTWLYMKDDHKMVGDFTADTPKLRTYPPQSKNPAMKPSTSTSLGFIRLKPTTVTSKTMNITLMSPTSSEGFSNCTTSTPVASSSNSVPSSELVRQLSLGLRARPSKPLNKSNPETGSIKVVDTKLLMSPEFLGASSSTPSTSTATTAKYSTESAIQSKPTTLTLTNTMQSNSDWKDVAKGVPIRGRRFTTFVPNNKPTLKRMLQQPIADKPSPVDKPLNVQPEPEVNAKPKSIPSSIRERRYTTIVSTGGKPLITKNLFQSVRPPVNVKNFELVQNPGNKLTLAPIPVKDSSSHVLLNRPVIIKKIDAAHPVTLHRSKSIDLLNPLKHRPLSPSNKQSNIRPVASTSVAGRQSSGPVMVIKPSNFNLNMPAKVSSASIALDGKSFVLKKSNHPVPTLRLMPPNIRNSVNRNPIKVETESTQLTDSDDESTSKPLATSMPSETSQTVNGYFISQVEGLGKIMAKRLFAAYSLNLPGGSKVFRTFKICVDYLNKTYLKDKIFAMVPANLMIEWKFVVNESTHGTYQPHDDTTLRMSMVLTDTELIDLNSDFHSNERFPLELRHHLLVLRLAHTCMTNSEARHKSGLDIVRKSEVVINGLKAENKKLHNNLRALRIEKRLNILKLNELKKRNAAGASSGAPVVEQTNEIITIDSEDE
ncbi:hypothetical protein HA402_004578 [Bradysia odoriphaga]|nr:hypothetical protein HA402_004578 [Bradysia odoriphaga]